MRAAVVERPGTLAVRDLPEPEVGPYDALCDLLFGATCTGTDQHILHARLPWEIDYPTIPGHESVGRVVRVGSDVRYLRLGDLVTRVGAPAGGGCTATWGGFAQRGIARDHRAMREDGLPRAEWDAFRVNQVLPPDTDPAAATMVVTWRETLSYYRRLTQEQHGSLLVIGSGGNGLAFLAHARNAGAPCVACLGSAGRLTEAESAGAHLRFDYRSPQAIEDLRAVCPHGFDTIIDAVGRQDALDAAPPLLSDGGTLGVYGIDEYGRCAIDPTRARGTFTVANRGYDEEETHADVIDRMRRGLLDARIWFGSAQPWRLEEIADAFEAIRTRQVVKALVQLSP